MYYKAKPTPPDTAHIPAIGSVVTDTGQPIYIHVHNHGTSKGGGWKWVLIAAIAAGYYYRDTIKPYIPAEVLMYLPNSSPSTTTPTGYPVMVTTQLSSSFGIRKHPTLGVTRLHAGVDLPVPIGTPVHATADGQVTYAGWSGDYGNIVIINHGAYQTRYAHLHALKTTKDTVVRKGDLIAETGNTGGINTGAHLHYEVRKGDEPVDPLSYMEGKKWNY